jgi:hypothetical protein
MGIFWRDFPALSIRFEASMNDLQDSSANV